MLWKTPWSRRRGGLISQPPVGMWFFDLGGDGAGHWTYNAALVSPAFTDGPPPFWFGAVVAGPSTGLCLSLSAGTPLTNGIFLSVTNVTDTTGADNQLISTFVNPTGAVDRLVLYDPGGGPSTGALVFDYSTVTVVLVRATPSGGTLTCDVFIDNMLAASFTGVPYVAATTALKFGGGTGGVFPSVNGVAGGVGALTNAQVTNWFYAVKSARAIQQIAGVTTDLWSATAVQPLAPASLPNQSTGQALDLTAVLAPGRAAANTLVQVSFNY